MIELRDAGDFWSTAAWATRWTPPVKPYFVAGGPEGTFLEQMARNPFRDATSGREPVELRYQHRSDGPVYARTQDGTLKFTDEPEGLLLGAALRKSDTATRTLVAEIRANHITAMSVGMVVAPGGDTWSVASDGRTALRTIENASLIETSFVSSAANKNATIVSLRHEQRSAGNGGEVEYRSFSFAPVTLIDDTEDLRQTLEFARLKARWR